MEGRHWSNKRLKKYGGKMLEMVCELKNELLEKGKHPVTPAIKPGDVRKLLPKNPPQKAEDMEKILNKEVAG